MGVFIETVSSRARFDAEFANDAEVVFGSTDGSGRDFGTISGDSAVKSNISSSPYASAVATATTVGGAGRDSGGLAFAEEDPEGLLERRSITSAGMAFSDLNRSWPACDYEAW